MRIKVKLTSPKLTFAAACLMFCAMDLVSPARAQITTSVAAYGAKGDAILRTDGTMMAGSPVLTSVSGSFSTADAGKYIEVVGAGPGGTSHNDAAMSAGSAVLSSASGTFAASDVGRHIIVLGAGASGSNLLAAISSYASANSVTLSSTASSSVTGATYYYGAMTLEGNITSVQSPSQATLNVAAAATITGASYAYGTDDHAAFQSALDSTGQAGGGTVHVPQPTSCPSGAVCGYVVKASDQMTASAPGAVKIRYSNVSLVGDDPQTNLFCRGAWATYWNSPNQPGQLATIRGHCVSIGDNGGPNGTAGEAVSNVSISQLHLYGMTDGNTYSVAFSPVAPPLTTTGDGWDITNKGIYMWDNSAFSNITIDSVVIQDFKGENIYSGGSVLTGMVIKNSTMTNFNGDGISMLAADLQVLNNTMSNGSNAGIENSTVGATSAALVRQLYQSNTISRMAREGLTIVGVDSSIPSGAIQISSNYFDTIAQTNRSGAETAVYLAAQTGGPNVPPDNVTISGNTCHDCFSFGVLETSGNTQITGNTFIVDRYSCSDFLTFTFPMNGFLISNNSGYMTTNALSNGIKLGTVYLINPGYATGNFAWDNVTLENNSWNFPGTSNYTFSTTSGPGWQLVTNRNLTWIGDSCQGCTYPDVNHGLVNLASGLAIEPYGPVVNLTGNSGPVTATVDASKEQDGSQLTVVNAGSQPVTLQNDSNLALSGSVTLSGAQNSVKLVYSAAAEKFTIPTQIAVSVAPLSASLSAGQTAQFTATVTGSSQGATWSVTPAGLGSISTTGLYTAPSSIAMQQIVTVTAASVQDTSKTASATITLNSPVTPPSGGSLKGSVSTSPAGPNLTTLGTTDWVHWGLASPASFDRKANVTPQISDYSKVGSGTVLSYSNNLIGFTWSDGTPDRTAANSTTGIYVAGQNNGFAITAPADTVARQLSVYVGAWRAQGKIVAHLSDNSAADYVDTTIVNYSASSVGLYTFTYSAAHTGQTLTVTFTQASTGGGNVTLQAAALAEVGADFALSEQPDTGAAGPAYTISVSPLNGFDSPVSFGVGGLPSGVGATFNPSTVTGSGTTTLTLNPGSLAAGTYPFTVTASSGTISHSVNATLTVSSSGGPGGNGSLAGNFSQPPSGANLTALGTSDWAHWGLSSPTSFDHKANVAQQISNYQKVGIGTVLSYGNNPVSYTWTDGTPDTSVSATTTGIYSGGIDNGFSITAPADGTMRTLSVYVGVYQAQGKLVAHLSDGSAADFTDTSLTNYGGTTVGLYTLTYKAASSGQTLSVTFTQNSSTANGNVTLQSAALH